MQQIEKFFESVVPGFPKSAINQFLEIGKLVLIEKGTHVLQEGQIPRSFWFVVNGLFRYYYLSNEGKEFTKGFISKDSIAVSYTAMKNERISYYSIQALTTTQIFEVNYVKWMTIYKSNLEWDRFLIALLEKGYSTKEKRERDLLLFDAVKRYSDFRKEYGHLEQQIKQHIVASYLGITPVALSRIRNKMGLINLG